MKVKVIVEFTYGEKMTKDIEQFAKEQNMPIEYIARIGMENLLDDCYECADDETCTVRAELLED
jgi:hypothetical protein